MESKKSKRRLHDAAATVRLVQKSISLYTISERVGKTRIMSFSAQVEDALKTCREDLIVRVHNVGYFGGPLVQGLHAYFLAKHASPQGQFEFKLPAILPDSWLLALYMIFEESVHKISDPHTDRGSKANALSNFVDEIFIITPSSSEQDAADGINAISEISMANSENPELVMEDRQAFENVGIDVIKWVLERDCIGYSDVNMLMTIGRRPIPSMPINRIFSMIDSVKSENPLMARWPEVVNMMTCKGTEKSPLLRILSKEPHLLLLILSMVEMSWKVFAHWAV